MKKPGLIVLGVVLVILGCTFTLQGLGYLAGSAMTDVTLWAIVGPIVAILGIVLIVRAGRALYRQGSKIRPGAVTITHRKP